LPVLDLVADRAVVRVVVPQPPRGGSAPFMFGEGRAGWVARIPDAVQLPALAYGGGQIYASGGFESRTFYGLDAETGDVRWATTNLEDDGPTAPVYDDDRVIFTTESCTLFALDARTGKRLWQKRIGDPTYAQTAVSGGLIYASHPGESGQELSAYRARDGELVWSRATDGELLAAPVVAGDSVYASTVGGTTFRFARDSGKLRWSRYLGATTAPWIAGDELFVTRRQRGREQQVVVDAVTGKLVREQQLSHGKYAWDVPSPTDATPKALWQFEGSRPVIDRGVRYVAMGGELAASDAGTGELLWQRRYADKQDQRSLGSVALAGSAIVVATRDGQLFALDIDTGYTLWSYALGHAIHAEPVVARGWLYAATDDGFVVALHVADTTLDGWHMFGGNPEHEGPVMPPAPTRARGVRGAT
jgi:Ca-activated chloride channel family protein